MEVLWVVNQIPVDGRTDAGVDIVVTWVSADDTEWLLARAAALGDADPLRYGESTVRFRDWGLLPFWFRAVEENAPWVRRIHLVTDTKLPSWLDVDHPRLSVVRLQSLDPDGPRTFNSHAVEAKLDRIPGLAERFLYLNDDFYLTSPVTPEFFFPDGMPYADPMPMLLTDGDVHAHAVLNAAGVINQHFDLDSYLANVLPRARKRRHAERLCKVLDHTRSWRIPPITDHHLATPLLKSSMTEAFAAAGAAVERTRHSIFRSREDIAPISLATQWQVATGRFSWVPKKRLGRYTDVSLHSAATIAKALRPGKHPQVCVNDGEVADFERVRDEVYEVFSRRWPVPSTFESVREERVRTHEPSQQVVLPDSPSRELLAPTSLRSPDVVPDALVDGRFGDLSAAS